MKTTITTIISSFKQMFAILFCIIAFSTNTKAQCAANFTYTINANGNVTFQNTSANTPTNTSYYWSFGNNQTSTLQTTSTTYTANGIYSVSLFIYSVPTCSAGITQTINITNVTTNTTACNLAANFGYTIGTNGNVNFKSTSTGTNSNTFYSWSFGNNTFGGGANTTANYSMNGFYTVCLFISDSTNNCNSSFCDTLSITNTATNTACNASFAYSVTGNGNTMFFNTSTGTSANTIYTWSFNNSTTASGPNPTTTFTNYFNWACLTILDTVTFCQSTFCDSIIVPSNPCNANVNFTMIQDSTQALTWWAFANYPQNTTNVVWSWGDNTTSTGFYPAHTYSASGFYNICVTITVSCSGTASFCANSFINKGSGSNAMYHVNVIGNLTNPTGIKNNAPDLVFETGLYPNPVKDIAHLKLNCSQTNEVTVSIYEITGKQLSEKKVNVNKGMNEINIETNELNKGFYLMNVNNGTSKKTIRLIKD